MSPLTLAPKEQLIYQVNIIPILYEPTKDTRRLEEFAHGTSVYIGETLCGQASQMPADTVNTYRVLSVRCNQPIWGTDLTIKNYGPQLGFYSVSIQSVGEKLISFTDVAKLKKTSQLYIDTEATNAEKKFKENGNAMNTLINNYWTGVKDTFENTELLATLQKKSRMCTLNDLYTQMMESTTFKSVNDAAATVYLLKKPGEKTAFMWNSKLNKAGYCGP